MLKQLTVAVAAVSLGGFALLSAASAQETNKPKAETKPAPAPPAPESSEADAPPASSKFPSEKALQSYSLGMYFGPNNRYYFQKQDLDIDALRQGLNDVFQSEKDLSYAVGVSVALQIAHRNAEVDIDQLLAGLVDTFQYKKAKVTREEQRKAMGDLEAGLKEKRQQEIAASATENEKKGKAFLAENAKREGVQKTESGLQYEIITKGPSDQKPGNEDTVSVNYVASLLNGRVYDRNDEGTPKRLSLKSRYMIPGWKEGLQMMTVGSRYKFYIPHGLGYGMEPKSSAIGGNETLIWEVELLSTAPPRQRPQIPQRTGSAVTPPVRVPLQNGKTGKATAVTPPVKVEFPKPGDKDAKRGVRVTPPVKVEFPKKGDDKKKEGASKKESGDK